MRTPLINTKLHIPSLRPNLVTRTRLIEQIENRLKSKFTLISSPAGSGKSTLLSSWAAQHAGPIVWLSLDENDNDLTRFLTYLLGAIQMHYPGCGSNMLTALQAPSPFSIERLFPFLINDLEAVASTLVIVMDDYQTIVLPEIHDALIFFITHLPASVHLIIATRNDPPFPLPKLRANGDLNEIRAADVRFTHDEAAELFKTMLPDKLTAEEIAIIEARTEGWAVGLHLTGLALKDQHNASEFIRQFTGSHRFIIDYLTDEVFEKQPSDVQEFMLSISLLKQFNADLCNAVTGRDDSARLLDLMEAENLFLVALDDKRQWYRYHHLFADLLFHKLQHSGKISLEEFHSQAVDWYVSNGHVADALNHAMAGGDFQRAAQLIDLESASMIGKGETQTVQRWIEALPESVLRNQPNLCIALAWVYNLNNREQDLEPLLQMAEQALSNEQCAIKASQSIRGNAAILRAYTALGRDQPEKAVQLIDEALRLLPADDYYLRSIVSFTQGVVYKRGSIWENAAQALMDAYEIGQAAGNLTLALAGIIHLIEMYIIQGRLKQTSQMCQKVIQQHQHIETVPNLGFVYTKLAEIYYEWNELDRAAEYLELGLKIIEKMFADIGWTRDAFICLMKVKQIQEEKESAQVALARAFEINEQMQDLHDKVDLSYWQARLWLMQGNLTAARRWQLDAQNNNEEHPELIGVTLARILISRGIGRQALDLLAPYVRTAKAAGRYTSFIEILVLQALAHWIENDISLACAAMKEALIFAEAEGFTRVFIDAGATTAEILEHILQRSEEYLLEEDSPISPKTILRLLASFPDRAVSVSPLNEREVIILGLLAAGMKTPEIATSLFLSSNTIKWHLKNIYGKLGVHNRSGAIEQGRRLSLIH